MFFLVFFVYSYNPHGQHSLVLISVIYNSCNVSLTAFEIKGSINDNCARPFYSSTVLTPNIAAHNGTDML